MGRIKALDISGSSIVLDLKEIELLRSKMSGSILLRDDKKYHESREIWNIMIDREPAIISQCQTTNDIIMNVKFARENNLLLSIKGGGHNVAGNSVCEGGMMLDLSPMKSVTLAKEKQTVRVESGCLLSDVDAETQKHGLAVSAGIVSHTGVAGLTLGGGFGWISRKYGLTVDNLLSAEVVTVDGELLQVSKNENSDLFWAICGGGGNFGIVSSFTYRCADIGTHVYSGMIIHDFNNAEEYLRFHREYVRTLPDEMTAWMIIRKAPALPFIPKEKHGKMIIAIPFVYLGKEDEGKKLIQPIRDIKKPIGEAIGQNNWSDWQSGFDELNAHGARNYWKSHHLKELPDDCITKIIHFAKEMPSDSCEIFMPHMEGLPSRVDVSETAFAHRYTPFVLNIHTRWDKKEDDQKCVNWARDFFKETKQYANGVYVNFLGEEGKERIKDAYPKGTWDRLVEVKRKYDPTNFFRMNQNIDPLN